MACCTSFLQNLPLYTWPFYMLVAILLMDKSLEYLFNRALFSYALEDFISEVRGYGRKLPFLCLLLIGAIALYLLTPLILKINPAGALPGWFVAYSVLGAPVIEEIIYRRMLLGDYLMRKAPGMLPALGRGLNGKLWLAMAVVLQAAVFAISHPQFQGGFLSGTAISIFIFGMLAGLIYLKTDGDVFPLMLFHMASNALTMFAPHLL